MLEVADSYGEGAKGRGHVDVVEGAAHGVLAADGGQLQAHLCIVGTEQCSERLTPTVGVVAQFLEVFLEGEAHTAGVATCGSNLGDRTQHGIHGTVEGAPRGLVGIHAVAHDGHGVALAIEQRQLANHALGGRQLVLAAEGHHHAAGADTAVEHLDEAFLRADVEVGDGLQPKVFNVLKVFRVLKAFFRHADADGGLLVGAVGVNEAAAEVDNLFAAPVDDHTGFLGDGGHHRCLEVLFVGILQHEVDILGVDHDGHTLLALADSKLGAVKTGVFLGYAVEVYLQAVGQFAYGDAHATGAEVVALLDDVRHLFTAEQALYLAFGGGVAFLHLGTAGGQALGGVALRGTCGTADAVTSGAATKQDDDVAGVAGESLHSTTRSGGDDGANLHAFGHVVGVVNLVHQAGGEAYLVAV